MHPTNQRKKRLVRPKLQGRMILAFLGIPAFALLMQFVLFACALSTAASELPQDGQVLIEHATGIALSILAVTMCVLLPLAFAVGLAVTFRIAGPIHRFEQHLLTIVEGDDPGPCRIRKGDDLQDFCTVFNAALDRVRATGAFERMGAGVQNEDQNQPLPVASPDEPAEQEARAA